MSGEYGVAMITRVERFFVLWLGKIPVAFFGLVKMMPSSTGKPVFALDEGVVTITDGTAEFKHESIVAYFDSWSACRLARISDGLEFAGLRLNKRAFQNWN